jgi:hypothetical protein
MAQVQCQTAQVCRWKSVPTHFNDTKDAKPANACKASRPKQIWKAVEVPDIELVMQGPTAGYAYQIGSEEWQ